MKFIHLEKIKYVPTPLLKVNNIPSGEVSKYKYLSIIIDKYLIWANKLSMFVMKFHVVFLF